MSGFSHTFQAVGTGLAQGVTSAAVTAYARISSGARAAYVAFRADEVAITPAAAVAAR